MAACQFRADPPSLLIVSGRLPVRPFSKLNVIPADGSTRKTGGVMPRPETFKATAAGRTGSVLKLIRPVKEAAASGRKRTVTAREDPAASAMGKVTGTVSNGALSLVMPVRFSGALPSLRSRICN